MRTRVLAVLLTLGFSSSLLASEPAKNAKDKEAPRPWPPQKLAWHNDGEHPHKVPRMTQAERDQAALNKPKDANKVPNPPH